MKVLHATDRHDRSNTGITSSMNSIMTQIGRPPLNGSSCVIAAGKVDMESPQGVPRFSSAAASAWSGPWKYTPGYRRLCEQVIRSEAPRVVHAHGAWTHPILAAQRSAWKLGIPTVLSSHGQFAPWALTYPNRIGMLRKRAYLSLMRERLFDRFSILHAITGLERDSLHRLFPRSRIELISNAIEIDEIDAVLRRSAPISPEPVILSIGRLHPIKNLDRLIEAFGIADIPAGFRLVIIGPEEVPAYVEQLRALMRASPRADRIELRPPVWGASEKYALMRRAWATVVPSYCEVVGMVNLESAACGTPALTTHATGLADWEEGGGLLMDPTVLSIALALASSCRWNFQERQQRGELSRRLVERRYSTTATAPQWTELYSSL